MKKTLLAAALSLPFATAAMAQPATLADVEYDHTITTAILTTQSAQGMDGGTAMQTQSVPVGNLQSCLAIAFSASFAADHAAVSCMDQGNLVKAVFQCSKNARTRCTREF